MMRIVVVGGAGEVGAELVRDLARVEDIESLVVADLNADHAADIAAEVNSPRVSACELDVHDRESALKLLEGANVLMNCTSFSLFDTVFDLAAEAGVDYADLISEPSERHRAAAERAGITAISGLGASPGLSMDFAQAPSPEWWFPYERPTIDEREIAGAKVSPV